MKPGNIVVRIGVWFGCVPVAMLVALTAWADTVPYSEDRSIFPNPERGFWWPIDPPGGGIPGQTNLSHAPLQLEDLRALRGQPQAFSLIRDCVQLGMFMNGDISKQRLEEIQRDFDTVRAAGLKSVVRFLYDWGMLNRDPEEPVILCHLEQLEPLLRANADVIAVVQGGLYGGTGEGCRSDHGYVFGDPDSGGWQRLSPAGVRVYRRLLSIIPADRMMTVRYPRLKWDLLGWPANAAKALSPAEAYIGSDQARIGFYDDGFMGDARHFAMFQLPGESEFTAQDTQFVVMEGELSAETEYNKRPGQVLLDAARYHQVSLTHHRVRSDGGSVYDYWKANGNWEDVLRRMGYRYRLLESTAPEAARPSDSFRLTLKMANDGFARIHNPRLIEVVLRQRDHHHEFRIRSDQGLGNRMWLPGPGETKTLEITAAIHGVNGLLCRAPVWSKVNIGWIRFVVDVIDSSRVPPAPSASKKYSRGCFLFGTRRLSFRTANSGPPSSA